MRRVDIPVSLETARQRLADYRAKHGPGPHKAAWLAEVIWPDTHWIRPQGAGGAAVRILRRLGCEWGGTRDNWGWMI